ncbi:aquaporin TIP1-2-like [Abrus precatorius]|uniref:Aquaporin TIP1-2-like n=1 Tax=Abrus precatorius TaxID=3816 RepID=A0A8B8LMW8_ABRPR|nr:aquaporin TIP1-2-like [Abrus precatorius]
MDSVNCQVVHSDDQFPRPCQSHEVNRLVNKFLASIGALEIFTEEMWKAALTELTATASLVFTLTTSIIACLDSHEVDPKLLVPFAVFTIAFLFLVVTVPLSGGHMSPVFTFIAALKGVITLDRALIYILAQCIGSILGFLVLNYVMDPKLADTYSLGGCAIGGKGENSGVKPQNALLLEFTCTFVVLFVGVTLAFDKKRSKELGLPMVCFVVAGAMALAVFVSITVTGQAGYAGVGLNPARCLGPALFRGGSLWNGHWIFWLGPFLACIVYFAVSPKEGLVWEDEEYDVQKLSIGPSGTIHNSTVANDQSEHGSARFQAQI